MWGIKAYYARHILILTIFLILFSVKLATTKFRAHSVCLIYAKPST